MSRKHNDEQMLQYMVPGSTVADLCSTDDDEDYDGYFDVEHSKKSGGGTSSSIIIKSSNANPNAQQESTSLSKFQPAQHKHVDPSVLRRIKMDSALRSEPYGGGGAKANQKVLNELRDATMSQRTNGNSSRDVDRSERATVENVMDPRTRLILYKLVNTGILKEINGCVSTGKEANVYYAVSGDDTPAALKVYKTSILVFRDRDQYVAGEYRFQRYCKSNPRKMVRTWAEKEARNLMRLQQGGVIAPAVKLLRQHVLVMEFLGEDGWPAPRLKEVRFPSQSALDQCYLDLCCTMRKMYSRCRLIHGDLSEYNLLLYRGRVVVIDVSQSVEHDHPRAMDFLRRDIVNVNAFFRSKGHPELFSLQDLYFFITAPPDSKGWQRNQGPDNTPELLLHLKEMREAMHSAGRAVTDENQAKIDEQVFLNIAVPRTLNEVADHKAPNEEVAPFVKGMTAGAADERQEEEDEEDASSDGSSSDGDGDDREDGDEENEDEDDEEGEGKKRRKKKKTPQKTLADMTKDEKKAHHKAVKEANRERRQEKKKKGITKYAKKKK